MLVLNMGDATVVKLASPADTPRLQRLLEQCSDYYEVHEGWPTPADAAEAELTWVPPQYTADDVLVFGVEDESGTLQGMVQLLRNHPQRGTWWIAFLIVAPELRGGGIGSLLLRHADETAAADGATAIHLAVSVNNPRGQSFWESAGFRQTGGPAPATARSGHVDTVRIMSRDVLAVNLPPASP